MLFCHKCHLLRSDTKKGRHKNARQGYNEHDVVENEIEEGVGPQFGDGHDISNRGEIQLPGADHFRTSNDEPKSECGNEACFRGPGLLSDNSMDPFLQGHGKLKLHFCALTSTI